MLWTGAAGKTEAELGQALHLTASSDEAVRAFGILHSAWRPLDGPGILNMANGLWIEQAPVHEAYVQSLRKSFDAQASTVPVFDAQALDQINNWTRERTEGKIGHMLDGFPRECAAVLINAVAFKDEWARRFDPAMTAPSTFTRADGTECQVPFMFDRAPRQAFTTKSWSGVILPYRCGFEMRVTLPAATATVAVLLDNKDALTFLLGDGPVGAQTDQGDVELWLPKWKFATTTDLMPWLTKWAPSSVAEGKAEFPKIGPVWITQAIQKTLVEVDEEGTSASAATEAAMSKASTGDTYRFNRPFAFSVLDPSTRMVLILGVVNDPSK